MKKGQSAQMTLLTDMLDTASRRREGKPGAASHIERRGKKRIKRTRQIDNSKAKGYRWRRAELPDERDPREGPSKGRPTIKETRGKQGERGWRKEKWFGPREGPRRPKLSSVDVKIDPAAMVGGEGMRGSSYVIQKHENGSWWISRPTSKNVIAWADTAEELQRWAKRQGAKRAEIL